MQQNCISKMHPLEFEAFIHRKIQQDKLKVSILSPP
jgi:hypothetical protein